LKTGIGYIKSQHMDENSMKIA